MARLGLAMTTSRKINPRLIYCSISGYGQSGPRVDEAGHDLNYIGNTGLLDLQPGPPATPVVPPMLVADIAGGSFPAVINILLALRARDQSGQGCRLDIAMTDAMFTFAWYALAIGAATGKFPKPGELMLAGGSPRYQLYPAKDGKIVACGAHRAEILGRVLHGDRLAGGIHQRPARSGRRRAMRWRNSSRRAARTNGGRSWPPPIAARPSWCRCNRRCKIRISSNAVCSTTKSKAPRARRCRRCRCRLRRISAIRRARKKRRSWAKTKALPRASAAAARPVAGCPRASPRGAAVQSGRANKARSRAGPAPAGNPSAACG